MKKGDSYFLSYILRHKPDSIDLDMDKEGWVNIKDFIKKSKDFNKRDYDLELIKKIVKEDSKQRYTISENGLYIRASQGHSFSLISMNLKTLVPPDFLYHGTTISNIESILKNGLNSMKRKHVHLSDNLDTAISVGSRHGEVSVLFINSKKMVEDGYKFYLSDNKVWLTDFIPNKYIYKDLSFLQTKKLKI